MKKIKITTPENIEVEYNLADIGSRTAAMVIDYLIQAIGFFFVFIVNLIVFVADPDYWIKNYGWFVGISLIVITLISYGYYMFTELKMNGMTIGKKKMNIRVIRTNGQPISLSHSALRNFFKVFIDSMGVGVIMIFFSKHCKRLGDMVASTIVVAEESNTKPITLEGLEKANDNLSYYLSKEEYELVKEYFERKGTLINGEALRQELKQYFIPS
ncbi:MAG: RDD family protein [Clostridia bacterium]|nr:RDD family protein [Clostridia bacterium]